MSLIEDINDGHYDEALDAVIELAVARRNFLRDAKGARNKVEFQHGDAVRVVDIRPKYLTGITGTINKHRMPAKAGQIMVDIEPRCWHRLGRYGHTLSVPASSLERV